jgi:VIT1/CCC1 family predicted Fe2+/Mn2+ transporter
MLRKLTKKIQLYQTKFSFGMTSATVTDLALIVGLNQTANAKMSIIAAILIIALADNISDSLGIHIFQESERIDRKEIWLSTSTNFITRILVSLTFMLLVIFLPMNLAVISSIVWGLLLLTFLSYTVAKDEGINPSLEVIKHLGIAILVILGSELIRRFILMKFS